ncbi:MAG: carboxylate-amine ligase [Elainellaceae cyanobacterium]
MTEALTLGVEEEYQVIDPETRELTGRAGHVMAIAQADPSDTNVQREVYQSQIEIATPVCGSLAEARAELVKARRTILSAASEAGSAIAAAGTHPFSDWRDQAVTETKVRYRRLVQDYRQIMRDLVIFGCHVHVGISDREMAVQVLNRSRIWLPVLLALCTNSPFWLGRDTSYASYRTELWSRWPFAGLPFPFKNDAEYRQVTDSLVAIGAIRDATKIYWDIRLSEHVPTIEFRFADVCTTVDEAVMLAGLVRALAQTCLQEVTSGQPPLEIRPELLQAARWQAARHGMNKSLIDVIDQRPKPARQVLDQFLDYVTPALRELGDRDEVTALVQQTLERGTGDQRQRRAYERSQRFEDVVDGIVSQTAEGIF